MAELSSVKWSTENSPERTSYMIAIGGNADVAFEARSAVPSTVNAVLKSGEYVFMGSGSHVSFSGRLYDVEALELLVEGQVAYRALVAPIVREEVLDPTPAVVHSSITENDHIAYAVRMEVEKYLRGLGRSGYFSDDVDPDDLVDDIMNGDLDFDQEDEDDGFVSRSYESMAEERPSSSVSGNAEGVGGTGEVPPAAPPNAAENPPVEPVKVATT